MFFRFWIKFGILVLDGVRLFCMSTSLKRVYILALNVRFVFSNDAVAQFVKTLHVEITKTLDSKQVYF